jgi:hypothetical protein
MHGGSGIELRRRSGLNRRRSGGPKMARRFVVISGGML